MHELAVASGFSAAYRLGAKYPFSDVEGCGRLFKLYLAASHGMRAVCANDNAFANDSARKIDPVFLHSHLSFSLPWTEPCYNQLAVYNPLCSYGCIMLESPPGGKCQNTGSQIKLRHASRLIRWSTLDPADQVDIDFSTIPSP